MTGMADYSALLYIALGAFACLLMKRVADSSALSKKVRITYSRREPGLAHIDRDAGMAEGTRSRREITADYLHEAAVVSGMYGLDTDKLLGSSVIYSYRGYELACAEEEQNVTEMLPLNAFDYSSMMSFMHSFGEKGARLLFMDACGHVVINDALLR